MYAVNGVYEGGGVVKIEQFMRTIETPYKVVVTFIEPAKTENNEVSLSAKKAAFKRLSAFHKSLPADFDAEKALNEYRDEKFDNFN
jgi:hypothetical protein